jgi:quinolinate synthase
LIERVRELKARRKAVVLAHNYQRPEIFETSDAVGDSLALSRRAAEIAGEVIVFAGVHFMAETAKILNPASTVLLPNPEAQCSLADSATPADLKDRIRELKTSYPDLAVVSYVNTTAAVKALSDVCCTSGNAVEIVNALPNRHVLFLPDRNLAAHVAGKTDKTVIPWEGDCYVHRQIAPEGVALMKSQHPAARLLVHPECRPDVTALADAVLSTEGMIRYARESAGKEFIVVTECGLSDRLQIELPGKTFYRACQLCRFMKATRMEDLVASLERMQFVIDVPDEIRVPAERAVRRMLELGATGAAGATAANQPVAGKTA